MKLSVCTLNDSHNFILKDNNKILVLEKERQQMMGLAHAENHNGPEGILNQLRRKAYPVRKMILVPNLSKRISKI